MCKKVLIFIGDNVCNHTPIFFNGLVTHNIICQVEEITLSSKLFFRISRYIELCSCSQVSFPHINKCVDPMFFAYYSNHSTLLEDIYIYISADISWHIQLLDLKMGSFNAICHILLLCSHSLPITACDVKHTNQPTYGDRCDASSNTEVTLWQTDRPQCVWKCLKLKTCRYINHNSDTGQCDLGLDKCETLVPAVGVAVSAFGPPRDTCVHWGSRHQHGRVPVEVRFLGKIIYLARMITENTLLVGKFNHGDGWFWANNDGVRVGPVLEKDQNIEFLTMDPACTLPWMAYMAGGLLPVGIVSGGLLPDGSTTYVSKVTHHDLLTFGYYNAETERVYYELGGVHTKASMEILVLL